MNLCTEVSVAELQLRSGDCSSGFKIGLQTMFSTSFASLMLQTTDDAGCAALQELHVVCLLMKRSVSCMERKLRVFLWLRKTSVRATGTGDSLTITQLEAGQGEWRLFKA